MRRHTGPVFGNKAVDNSRARKHLGTTAQLMSATAQRHGKRRTDYPDGVSVKSLVHTNGPVQVYKSRVDKPVPVPEAGQLSFLRPQYAYGASTLTDAPPILLAASASPKRPAGGTDWQRWSTMDNMVGLYTGERTEAGFLGPDNPDPQIANRPHVGVKLFGHRWARESEDNLFIEDEDIRAGQGQTIIPGLGDRADGAPPIQFAQGREFVFAELECTSNEQPWGLTRPPEPAHPNYSSFYGAGGWRFGFEFFVQFTVVAPDGASRDVIFSLWVFLEYTNPWEHFYIDIDSMAAGDRSALLSNEYPSPHPTASDFSGTPGSSPAIHRYNYQNSVNKPLAFPGVDPFLPELDLYTSPGFDPVRPAIENWPHCGICLAQSWGAGFDPVNEATVRVMKRNPDFDGTTAFPAFVLANDGRAKKGVFSVGKHTYRAHFVGISYLPVDKAARYDYWPGGDYQGTYFRRINTQNTNDYFNEFGYPLDHTPDNFDPKVVDYSAWSWPTFRSHVDSAYAVHRNLFRLVGRIEQL